MSYIDMWTNYCTYSTCDACNIDYRDDNDFVCHCDCGSHFCNKDCGKLENYLDPLSLQNLEEGDPLYINYINEDYHINDKAITCIICRHEVFDNDSLLDALMKHFNLNKDQVIEIWKGKVK